MKKPLILLVLLGILVVLTGCEEDNSLMIVSNTLNITNTVINNYTNNITSTNNITNNITNNNYFSYASGSGTTNYIPRWRNATTLNNSQLYFSDVGGGSRDTLMFPNGIKIGRTIPNNDTDYLGYTSILIGDNATGELYGGGAVVIGNGAGAFSYGTRSVVLGQSAYVGSVEGVAIGYQARVNSSSVTNAVAIGAQSAVSGADGTAIGSDTIAAASSTAIGSQALVNASGSIAIGYASRSTFSSSTVIGNGAIGNGTGSTVIGYNAKASEGSIAIGQNTNNGGTYSVLIGYGSTNLASGIVVGLTNVGNASNGITIGSNNNNQAGFAFGASNSINKSGTNGIAIGSNGIVGGSNSIAIGPSARAFQGYSIAIGSATSVYSDNALAIGNSARVYSAGQYGVALGNAVSNGSQAIAIGFDTRSYATQGIQMGGYGTMTAGCSQGVGIGYLSDCNATSGIALGYDTNVYHAESIALGRTATTTATNQLMIGASGNKKNTVIWGTLNVTDNAINGLIYTTSTGRVGIGQSNPAYTLVVNGNVSGISIWSQANISASGYITRTDVYKESTLASEKLYNSSYYLINGKVDHKKFGYSYVNYTTTINNPLYNATYVAEYDSKKGIPFNNTIGQPYINITEEGVDLVKEVALLKQALYEIKVELEKEKAKTTMLENNLLNLNI